MAKKVKVEGRIISVPDDATPDEIDELLKSSAPKPPSGMDKMIENIPGSLYKAVTHPTFPGMPVGQGDATHPATFEDFKAKTLPKVIETVKHPIDTIKNSFIDDPVGSGLTAAAMGRGAFPNTAGTIEGAMSGGARAASEQVRPLLSKFSPFMHPAKMLPDLYDAGKNVISGMRQGVDEFRGVQSPFTPKPKEVLPPSLGGRTPEPRDVFGSPIERPAGPESTGTFGKVPIDNNIRPVDTPYETPKGTVTSEPFKIRGPRLPQSEGIDPHTFRPVTRASQTISDIPETPDTNLGPTVKPVLPSGRSVPTSRTVETKAPKMIVDEKGQPLTPEDPINGVTEKDFDIHKKIAQEGLEKRVADSKAKYEDVYQNLIKGNYSPEELRKLATDAEAKTSLDMQIKNLKHPEGHAKSGHRKYGSGLNPQMIETLAQRLEAEQP